MTDYEALASYSIANPNYTVHEVVIPTEDLAGFTEQVRLVLGDRLRNLNTVSLISQERLEHLVRYEVNTVADPVEPDPDPDPDPYPVWEYRD